MDTKAHRFEQLHLSGDTFIMANAWNPGSAVLLEQAGFEAIGTTSAGIAFSHALPDYQGELSFEAALEETRRIADVVEIPVSMDGENGYGDSPDAVFRNFQQIAQTGVVGASIEDHCGEENLSKTRSPNEQLYDIDLATDRVRAAKEAANSLPGPFMITARAECYLVGHENPFSESVKRVSQYREAGADCLFIPGVRDITTIRQIVKEVEGPINVVMGLSGTPLTVAELQDAGVNRISIGGSLARATMGFVRQAAREMLDNGTFNYAAQQIKDAELCALFQGRVNQKNQNKGDV